MEEWLKYEIKSGFSALYALPLQGKPAEDMVKTVRDVWFAVLSNNRHWQQERDTPRIKMAFMSLLTRADNFPTPKQFLDALPSHTQGAKALPKPVVSKETAEKNKAKIRAISQGLADKIEQERKAKAAARQARIKDQQEKVAGLLKTNGIDQGGNLCPQTCTPCTYFSSKKTWLTGVLADAIAASKHNDPEAMRRSAAQLRNAAEIQRIAAQALRKGH